MTEKDAIAKKTWLNRGRWILMIVFGVIVFWVLAVVYVNLAFPKVRRDTIDHLNVPEELADCLECHLKSTPKVTQDWSDSKHGVMLVKCFVCHGQPDGEGSVPWAVDPDVDTTCRKCHDTSINHMEEKYGLEPTCNSCHPFHNNSLHHQAYEKTKAARSFD